MKGLKAAFIGEVWGTPSLSAFSDGTPVLTIQVRPHGYAGRTVTTVRVIVTHNTALELAERLQAGMEAYCEGRLTLEARPLADGGEEAILELQASLVQLIGLIGEPPPEAA